MTSVFFVASTKHNRIFYLASAKKFVHAKRLMNGSANDFIECKSKSITFEELTTELIKEYGNLINSAHVHQKLRERRKTKILRENE